jgi:hypothetical protein
MEINKYQNGKIYQIVSFSHPDLIYYGSTIQTLSMRFAGHRRDTKKENSNSSKQIICFDDAKILLIENYPCNSKEELTKKEAEYIITNECVNKLIPCRTCKEWREDNKDIIKEKAKKHYQVKKEDFKKYREDNKEVNKVYFKKYREDNKESKNEYNKKYREGNKENISKKNAEIIKCECGLDITKGSKSRHIKSKIHINNLEKY